jgi:UDP-N-acetylmuramate--alanine ligase
LTLNIHTLDLSTIHNVYFLGIGGIGMSALARWFKRQGCQVSGYDLTPTPLTTQLENEGIPVHFTDDPTLIPGYILKEREASLIIYTPAIPQNHQEYQFLKKEGFTIYKRAQVLGKITEGYFTVAIGGTHGKTSTTAMASHILTFSQKNCTAFIGGIVKNYDSNLIAGEGTDQIVVTEADEFDRSFLNLHPNLCIVTSVDADHLDIYGKDEEVKEGYASFVRQCSPTGTALLQTKVMEQLRNRLSEGPARLLSYGLEEGNYRAQNVYFQLTDGKSCFIFDMIHPKGVIKEMQLYAPGFHNVENAIAATAAALQVGIPPAAIKEALSTFEGVKRRFDYILTQPLIFIDDYAHHPTEIQALLESVKAIYPNKKITVIFQPHLYSRTRDFVEGFAESLSLADELILLPIYPARELPMEGITSDIIIQKVNTRATLCSKENLLEHLAAQELEVVLTVGAGDIDQLVIPIRELLEKKR